MGSRFFQRPENAISKAEEFINVGKPVRALDTLYDVIKSKKRHHNFSEKLIEQIMFKYLELCVDLKKSHIAKEGLFQYRNMCQLTNVASLASVVQGYLTMAEQRTEKARQESAESAAEVDDLDNLMSPEMIMLSAVSGEDAQDRSDRKILMPWVKFLWESYCQCLELLRTNIRVERLYHDIAQQAFRFCLKYQRKTEFRKLCDKLRNHLELVVKQTPSQMSINLNNADTQQMNLDTRLAQLDAAIKMELWQEAYKAVEDIHGLMTMSKKTFQPKMMANYYQKLALVFWKSGNHLFHAAAVFKHFQLTREMKKNISTEEHGKMASLVLAACLAVPVPSHHPEFDKFIETDRTPQEKMARLAVLLSLPQPPTRQSLLKDAVRFGVVSVATEPLQDLYKWLEVEFHPLLLCKRVEATLKVIEDDNDEKSQLQQYLPALREITLVRLLKQVSQVYQSICFKRLLELAPFATSFELERVIVDCVRHNDMQVRVDHRSKTVHFGTELAEAQSVDEAEGPHLQDMPSEQIRAQLMLMQEVLAKSLNTIQPEKQKRRNDDIRRKIVEYYQHSKARDQQNNLQRKKRIEERKEYMEKISICKNEEEQKKQESELLEKQRQEKMRLDQEREERERVKAREMREEIQQQHLKDKFQQLMQTEIGKKVIKKMDEKTIAELDFEQINIKQEEELENEKRLFITRLKDREKMVDHIERAKRQEELPLLEEAAKKILETDMAIWKKTEIDRLENAIKEREQDVSNRDRLKRMRKDKDDFMSTLLAQRKAEFDVKFSDHMEMMKKERNNRLEQRKLGRIEERKKNYEKEKEAQEAMKKEEKERKAKEEEERKEAQRKAQEEEEYRVKKAKLDEVAKRQRERELEIEEKQKREEISQNTRPEKSINREKEAVKPWKPRVLMEKRPVVDERKEEYGSWRRDKQNDQNIDAMNDKMQSVEKRSSHVIDDDYETEKSQEGFKAWKPKSLREERTMENERSRTDIGTSSSSLKSGRMDNSLSGRENERSESPGVWRRNNRKTDEVEEGRDDAPRGRENERPESPGIWGRNNRKMDAVEGGGNDPTRIRENERPESPGGWRTSNRKTDKAECEVDEGEWKNVTRKR